MGNASILFIIPIFYKMILRDGIMVRLNIERLLKNKGKSKYWLCQKMNITSRNLNRIIRGDTTSISFKYIEEFCNLLECSPNDLMNIIPDKEFIKEKNEKKAGKREERVRAFH